MGIPIGVAIGVATGGRNRPTKSANVGDELVKLRPVFGPPFFFGFNPAWP